MPGSLRVGQRDKSPLVTRGRGCAVRSKATLFEFLGGRAFSVALRWICCPRGVVDQRCVIYTCLQRCLARSHRHQSVPL